MKDKITEKELMIFSKKELIQVILKSGWIFNPIAMLYRNRTDANYDMVTKLLNENSSLVKKVHTGMEFKTYSTIHEAIEKNHKKINRLYAENEKIEKILYGDILKEGDKDDK